MKRLQFLAVLLAVTMPLTLAGCGKNKKNIDYKDDYIIAKVNDKDNMDYATAYTYVKILQAEAYSYTQNILKNNNSTTTNIWSTKLDDDSEYKTYGEQFKGDALNSIKELLLCQAHSDEYNITFSDEDEDACNDAAAKVIENTGEEAAAAMHADKDSVSNVLKLLAVEERVKNEINKNVDTEVSADDAGQSTFSYVKITKKDNKNPEKLAKKIIKNTNNGTDFKTVVSDEGLTTEDISFTTTIPEYDEYGKEMLKHALKMKDGDCDSYGDSNKNIVVMYMKAVNDEDATETKKSEIIEERKNDAYDEVIKNWEKEGKVDVDKKAWNSIPVDDNTIFTTKSNSDNDSEGTKIETGDSSISVNASLSDENSSDNTENTKGDDDK